MGGPAEEFLDRCRRLESTYLESDDPIAQSGFSGGRERWVAERSPLIEAIDRDGDFLDVGCANGLLAADVTGWAANRGITLTPHGIDLGSDLVDLARHRLPDFAHNFVTANAWTWQPDRLWTFVYSLLDLSPPELWCDWVRRLLGWVEPGGRLILGSYGSRSRGITPAEVAAVMQGCGLPAEGSSAGGEPVTARFAWTRPP